MKANALKHSSGGKILMNKGKIGRWQEMMNQEQSARIDRITGVRFANTGIEHDYGDNPEKAKKFYSK